MQADARPGGGGESYRDDNCDVNRFIAGSTKAELAGRTSPVDVAARWRETGGGLQPHFLLAPSVYGVARA